MTGGQIRVIEIISGLVKHADSFHDPPRSTVVRDGKGHNLVKPQDVEPECQRRTGTFGRIAAPPELRGKTPSDFRTRRKRCVEPGTGKADEASERRKLWNFDGPEPPAVLTELVLNPFGEKVAFFSGEWRRKIFHHPRVRIQAGERSAIARNPRSQSKPGRAEL
jgi:hypothetical protein